MGHEHTASALPAPLLTRPWPSHAGSSSKESMVVRMRPSPVSPAPSPAQSCRTSAFEAASAKPVAPRAPAPPPPLPLTPSDPVARVREAGYAPRSSGEARVWNTGGGSTVSPLVSRSSRASLSTTYELVETRDGEEGTPRRRRDRLDGIHVLLVSPRGLATLPCFAPCVASYAYF